MASYTLWFLLAFGLLALEMATGTFTMLMLGIACGVGGAVALLGFGLPLQFVAAAVAAVIGTWILRRSKKAGAPVMPDFDVGQAVQSVSWGDDGRGRAHYRGADWNAVLASGVPESARADSLQIVAIRGSTLVLAPRKP